MLLPRLCPALLLPLALLPAQDQSFRVQSRLVQVPVVVTDAQGRNVDGLEEKDFRLLDNGRPQSVIVDSISTGLAPVALAIAVQSSGISYAALEKIRTIGPLFQPLVTGERGCAAVVSFSEVVQWLQPCTSDSGLVGIALEKIRPLGFKRARLLDAASEAIGLLKERRDARRVLLLLSESRDRGSETDLETVATLAQSAGVTVYAATFSAMATAFTSKSNAQTKRMEGQRRSSIGKEEPGAPPRRDRDPQLPPPEQQMDILGGFEELARLGAPDTTALLAQRTGGAVFSFTRRKGLEEAVQKLGRELHTQYVLSFAPEPATPGFHRIELHLARPGDFRIRARPGYWSGAN